MIWVPFKYLLIDHSEKRWYDFFLPAAAALGYFIFSYCSKYSIALVSADGLLSQVNGLLGVLAGFYVASLAAISTLENKSLDKLMDGDAPILKTRQNGKKYEKSLKRREYLRYLFGYLATLSFIMFFFGIAANLFYAPLTQAVDINGRVMSILLLAVASVYIFWLTNLTLNTFIGIYYLTEKLHDENASIETKSNASDDGVEEPEEKNFLDDPN